MLEPANALVEDFGDGWQQVDRWYTEGSITQWDADCSDFNRLGDIFNYGTPETVVWQQGGDQMFQRTDDFGWDAGQFAATALQIPNNCPSVEVGSGTVEIAGAALSELGPAPDRIGEGDPNGQVVAIKLSAYPHPSPETDIATPEFEPDRLTWMVIATRHNVVSQLVYSPAPELSTTDRLVKAVEAQINALLETPIEATGPFQQAEPPLSVAPGTIADAELYVDPVECANDGTVDIETESGNVRWLLTEPVPTEWRGRLPILGDLTVDGSEAEFSAYPGPPPIPGEASVDVNADLFLEGFTVGMTTGAIRDSCHLWEAPDDVPKSVSRPLDCDDRPIEEDRFPDEGQDLLDLAQAANPEVVEVRPLEPLIWAGFDGGGRIVVELALGDIENPDWQIFTCANP